MFADNNLKGAEKRKKKKKFLAGINRQQLNTRAAKLTEVAINSYPILHPKKPCKLPFLLSQLADLSPTAITLPAFFLQLSASFNEKYVSQLQTNSFNILLETIKREEI